MDICRNKRLLLFGTIAAIVIMADQLSKYLVCISLPLNGSENIIPGFLNFVHVKNAGVAFGTFSHEGNILSRIILSGISLIALFIIIWIIVSQPLDRYSLIGFALFFGGAAGNFVDRVIFGRVTDFIDMHVKTLHWPAFNLADSALTVGAVIFCIRLLISEKVKS